MEDVGEANAAIFEVHQMMLMDLDYVDSIKNIITTQEVNAEYAVATTGDNFSQMFASMDDAYMQGRAADEKMYQTDFSVSFRMPGKAVLWQMNR